MTSPAMSMAVRLLGIVERIVAKHQVSRMRLANIEDRLARLDGGHDANLAERQAVQAVIDNGTHYAALLRSKP